MDLFFSSTVNLNFADAGSPFFLFLLNSLQRPECHVLFHVEQAKKNVACWRQVHLKSCAPLS